MSSSIFKNNSNLAFFQLDLILRIKFIHSVINTKPLEFHTNHMTETYDKTDSWNQVFKSLCVCVYGFFLFIFFIFSAS